MNKQNGDGEDLYNIKKLNATFAISSLIVLIAIVGMVWADYAREWKVWQRAFNDLEIARTERAIAQADSAIDKTQLQQLEDSLKVVNDQLTQRQSDIDAAQKRVNSLAAQWYKIDQVARFAKATYDAQKYEYEKAAQIDSVGAKKRREQLDQSLARLTDLNEQVKQIAAQRDSAEVSLTQLTADREQIQKRIADLELSRTRLEKKLASISRFNLSTLLSKDAGRILSGLINDFFRNQPLVDFINPSLKIQQVVVDNIRENVNFSTIPKVDRCMTCHLAIEKPGYEEQQPFKSHPNLALFLDARSPHPMAKFGCTACHLGRGRGTTFASVAHTPHDA
ncbi:MAG: hypothetical protein HY710_16420, partial [Candidatus Latescibacteria bacterium]|nr:hypothetical protein [Candidatus Latescibacterota bacterium]